MSQVKQFVAQPLFDASKATTGPSSPPCFLGEGPVWDHRFGVLYWLDILKSNIHFFHWESQTTSCVHLVDRDEVGFAVPTTKRGKLLCGGDKGIFLVDLFRNKVVRTSHPEKHLPENRFNDGKVDPSGRLYAGTMHSKKLPDGTRRKGAGRLYVFSANPFVPPAVVEEVGPVTVSNGMGWSPHHLQDKHQQRRMYFIDSPTRQVVGFDHSGATGALQNRRVVFEAKEGHPDGMCVDAEGFLWVALIRAGKVVRVDPSNGSVVAQVIVSAPLVTSCCFGGPYLGKLFITTAIGTTMEAAETACRQQPQEAAETRAGCVFVADVGVSGMPMTPYRLHEFASL